MPKFLIEVQHESEQKACSQFVRIFLETGSHYLTHADWGCMDGEHSAWITVEADDKEQARMVLPAAYRSRAKIIALNKFKVEHINGQASLQPC